MTSCNDDELVARQIERLVEVEDVLANGAHFADEPKCHPLYPHAVAARQILARRICQLTEQLKEAEAVRRVWVDWCPYSVIEARLCNGEIISDAAFNLNLTGEEKPTTVVALCLATSARSTLSKD